MAEYLLTDDDINAIRENASIALCNALLQIGTAQAMRDTIINIAVQKPNRIDIGLNAKRLDDIAPMANIEQWTGLPIDPAEPAD